MSQTDIQEAKPPLGVFAIILDSFSILFRNFWKFIPIGLVAVLLATILKIPFIGFENAIGIGELDATNEGAMTFSFPASSVIDWIFYVVISALFIRIAFDVKLDRSNNLGTHLRSIVPTIIPISLLSIVLGILVIFGAIALIIGAFWVLAVFYMMIPIAVIERGGFSSLRQSAELTKEYRWPIVGLFALQFGIIILLFIVLTPLTVVLFTSGGAVIAIIAFVIINAMLQAFTGINFALVYIRLRQIKDGITLEQIEASIEAEAN